MTRYTVVATPGGVSATTSGTTINIGGLSAGINYTFMVKATNAVGDGAYSSASNGIVLAKFTSATTLVSSLNPSTFGSGVTLTATLSPSSATGSLTFKDGSTTIGTANLSHSSGALITSALSVGSHSLTAVDSGNANYATSTSNTVTQVVNHASSSVVLTSQTNPTTFGSTSLLTAIVTPSSASGSLTFKDGSTTLATITLSHGSGSTIAGTNSLSVGSHSLTVVYSGNSTYLTSTSNTVTQTVGAAPVSSSSASSTSTNSVIQSGSSPGGGWSPALYSVSLETHSYTGSSSSNPSAPSSSSNTLTATVTNGATPDRETQQFVRRICNRIPHRNFTPFTIQRINARLSKRYGMSCQ